MPWSCKACQALVARDDVSTCPGCGGSKTAWSVAAEHTRKFVLSTRKKLVALRGETFRTARGAPYRHRFTSWRETERASVLTAKRAARLMATDEVPDAHDLLCVRMTPPKTLARWVLTLSIKFEQEKVRDLALEFEPNREALDEDGAFSAYFVCVHGPEVAALRFPYIHVLDVTEATSLGHAPLLEVSGFRSAALPIILGELVRPEVAARVPFARERSFVRPVALPYLRALAERLQDRPEAGAFLLGLLGRGEPGGAALAGERARVVRAFLSGDAELLRAQFEPSSPAAPWGWAEVQHMLLAIDVAGHPCYAGMVDGSPGDRTLDALGVFQMAEGLPMSHRCDEPTLRALLARYMELLGRPPVAADRLAVGAGEAFEEHALADDVPAGAGQARVDAFLFAPPTREAPDAATYRDWCAGTKEAVTFSPYRRVAIRVTDVLDDPLADHPVRVLEATADEAGRPPDGGVDLVTNSFGRLSVIAPPSQYILELKVGDREERFVFRIDDELAGFHARLSYPLPRVGRVRTSEAP